MTLYAKNRYRGSLWIPNATAAAAEVEQLSVSLRFCILFKYIQLLISKLLEYRRKARMEWGVGVGGNNKKRSTV